MNYLIRKVIRKTESLFSNRAIVLSYHRIANTTLDPFCLSVSPQNFEQQLNYIARQFNVISVEELLIALTKRKVVDRSICITFDDGYQDNYISAKPLLEKYSCPACFFVPTFFIGKNCQFWWDELTDLIFKSPKLQNPIKLMIDGFNFEFYLDNDNILTNAQLTQLQSWKRKEVVSNKRCLLFLKLCELLTPLAYEQINLVLDELKKQAEYQNLFRDENYPMSRPQLFEMTRNFLFHVGLHTHTHSALGHLPEICQASEIAKNKELLQEITGKEVPIIAYPNGSYNSSTKKILKEQNVIAAFTTKQKSIMKNIDKYAIGRFKVKNWTGDQFKDKLNTWFSQ